MSLPVCTLSPVCNSDIKTDLPFSRVTLAVDGKQPPPDDDDVFVVVGGGGGVVVVVVVTGNKYYCKRVIAIFSCKILESHYYTKASVVAMLVI